jgi:hypothetical protein
MYLGTFSGALAILAPPLRFGSEAQIAAVQFIEAVEAAIERIEACERERGHDDLLECGEHRCSVCGELHESDERDICVCVAGLPIDVIGEAERIWRERRSGLKAVKHAA